MSRGRNKGRRYDGQSKLNYKKIFAVLVAIAVLVMIIISITKILKNSNVPKEKSNASYLPVYVDNKWGVINNEGNIVIEPSYNEMVIIPDKTKAIFVCVYDIDDTAGTYKTKVINDKNEELFTNYDKVEAIDNYDSKQNIWYEKDILRVVKDGKYGLINLEGTEILPCNYDEITALKSVTNNILVKEADKLGLVNEKGQKVIATEYKDILVMKEGYKSEFIVIDQNNKYGVVSTSGTVLVEPKYEFIKYIDSTELYAVKESDKWKVVNTNNEIFLDGVYDNILQAKGDNIIVAKEGKYGIVNKNGEEKIAPTYQDMKYSFSIYYIAKKDNKYGIIDLENETKVPFEYNNMVYVESGLFILADKSETETVIIDNNLSQKFTGIISEINEEKGYVKVYIEGEYKYYNFKFEQKSSSDILTANSIFLSKKDGKYGYVNKSGEVVVEYIYEDGTEQNEYGYCAVKKDGLWGSLNKIGNISLETSVNLDDSIYTDFIGQYHLSDDGTYYIK